MRGHPKKGLISKVTWVLSLAGIAYVTIAITFPESMAYAHTVFKKLVSSLSHGDFSFENLMKGDSKGSPGGVSGVSSGTASSGRNASSSPSSPSPFARTFSKEFSLLSDPLDGVTVDFSSTALDAHGKGAVFTLFADLPHHKSSKPPSFFVTHAEEDERTAFEDNLPHMLSSRTKPTESILSEPPVLEGRPVTSPSPEVPSSKLGEPLIPLSSHQGVAYRPEEESSLQRGSHGTSPGSASLGLENALPLTSGKGSPLLFQGGGQALAGSLQQGTSFQGSQGLVYQGSPEAGFSSPSFKKPPYHTRRRPTPTRPFFVNSSARMSFASLETSPVPPAPSPSLAVSGTPGTVSLPVAVGVQSPASPPLLLTNVSPSLSSATGGGNPANVHHAVIVQGPSLRASPPSFQFFRRPPGSPSKRRAHRSFVNPYAEVTPQLAESIAVEEGHRPAAAVAVFHETPRAPSAEMRESGLALAPPPPLPETLPEPPTHPEAASSGAGVVPSFTENTTRGLSISAQRGIETPEMASPRTPGASSEREAEPAAPPLHAAMSTVSDELARASTALSGELQRLLPIPLLQATSAMASDAVAVLSSAEAVSEAPAPLPGAAKVASDRTLDASSEREDEPAATPLHVAISTVSDEFARASTALNGELQRLLPVPLLQATAAVVPVAVLSHGESGTLPDEERRDPPSPRPSPLAAEEEPVTASLIPAEAERHALPPPSMVAASDLISHEASAVPSEGPAVELAPPPPLPQVLTELEPADLSEVVPSRGVAVLSSTEDSPRASVPLPTVFTEGELDHISSRENRAAVETVSPGTPEPFSEADSEPAMAAPPPLTTASTALHGGLQLLPPVPLGREAIIMTPGAVVSHAEWGTLSDDEERLSPVETNPTVSAGGSFEIAEETLPDVRPLQFSVLPELTFSRMPIRGALERMPLYRPLSTRISFPQPSPLAENPLVVSGGEMSPFPVAQASSASLALTVLPSRANFALSRELYVRRVPVPQVFVAGEGTLLSGGLGNSGNPSSMALTLVPQKSYRARSFGNIPGPLFSELFSGENPSFDHMTPFPVVALSSRAETPSSYALTIPSRREDFPQTDIRSYVLRLASFLEGVNRLYDSFIAAYTTWHAKQMAELKEGLQGLLKARNGLQALQTAILAEEEAFEVRHHAVKEQKQRLHFCLGESQKRRENLLEDLNKMSDLSASLTESLQDLGRRERIVLTRIEELTAEGEPIEPEFFEREKARRVARGKLTNQIFVLEKKLGSFRDAVDKATYEHRAVQESTQRVIEGWLADCAKTLKSAAATHDQASGAAAPAVPATEASAESVEMRLTAEALIERLTTCSREEGTAIFTALGEQMPSVGVAGAIEAGRDLINTLITSHRCLEKLEFLSEDDRRLFLQSQADIDFLHSKVATSKRESKADGEKTEAAVRVNSAAKAEAEKDLADLRLNTVNLGELAQAFTKSFSSLIASKDGESLLQAIETLQPVLTAIEGKLGQHKSALRKGCQHIRDRLPALSEAVERENDLKRKFAVKEAELTVLDEENDRLRYKGASRIERERMLVDTLRGRRTAKNSRVEAAGKISKEVVQDRNEVRRLLAGFVTYERDLREGIALPPIHVEVCEAYLGSLARKFSPDGQFAPLVAWVGRLWHFSHEGASQEGGALAEDDNLENEGALIPHPKVGRLLPGPHGGVEREIEWID